MRVFDLYKSYEVTSYDTTKGYLKQDKLIIKHHNEVAETQEQGHYETIKTYDNGGKDVMKVVDVPAVCAAGFGHYNRFVPYPRCNHITPPVIVTAAGTWECQNCNWQCCRPNEDKTLPCIKNIASEKLIEATLQILADK